MRQLSIISLGQLEALANPHQGENSRRWPHLGDIDTYNSVRAMFTHIDISFIEEITGMQKVSASTGTGRADTAHIDDTYSIRIPPSQSLTVRFKPLSFLIVQRTRRPIRFMPITIELSLCDDLMAQSF